LHRSINATLCSVSERRDADEGDDADHDLEWTERADDARTGPADAVIEEK
jgi:hypothetical protein